MEFDLKQLSNWLMETGLMYKPFKDLEESEIKEFCKKVYDSVIYQEFRPPYIENNMLIIPMDTHPKHKYWTKQGQSIKKTLEEMNADAEIIERYAPKQDGNGLAKNEPSKSKTN